MPFTASDPDAIVPPSTGTGGVYGDVCPQAWDEDFDRSQMSTQVLIGRQLPGNIPSLTYDLIDAGPPGDGELLVGPGPDYVLLVSKEQTSFPTHISSFLRYIKIDDTIRITSAASTGQTLGWRVTGTPIEHATYFEYPVFWTEGTTPFTGDAVIFTMQLLAEPPLLFFDALGKSLYGVETFNRTDLINSTTELFPTLADRILEVRGVNSVPRIEAVTIDARTGKFPMQNMELMSTASPEKPSRYRLRLAVDERPIFDRMMFVAGVRHFIARDEWTLRITLDVAEWAAQL